MVDPFGYGQSYTPSFMQQGGSGGIQSGNPGMGGGSPGGMGQPPMGGFGGSPFGPFGPSQKSQGMEFDPSMAAAPMNLPSNPGLINQQDPSSYQIDPKYLNKGSIMFPGQLAYSTGQDNPNLFNGFASNQNNAYWGRGMKDLTFFGQNMPNVSDMNHTPWGQVNNQFSNYFNNLNAYGAQYGNQAITGEYQMANPQLSQDLNKHLDASYMRNNAQSAYDTLYNRYASIGTFGEVGQ